MTNFKKTLVNFSSMLYNILKKRANLDCKSLFFINTENCMAATITGSYTYEYTVVAPSFIGATMSVTCLAGYAWNTSPSVSFSRTATCSNSTGFGAWVISGAPDQCLRTHNKQYWSDINIYVFKIFLIGIDLDLH